MTARNYTPLVPTQRPHRRLPGGIVRPGIKAMPARTPLPVCTHRGQLLDVTTCRCKVWHCKKHGTCSNNARAGLRVCKDCCDFTPPQ